MVAFESDKVELREQSRKDCRMKYCSMKEIDCLVRQLLKENWRFSRGGKHGRLWPPHGHRSISVPCTPSDKRAFLKWGIRMSAVSGATGCEEFPHIETAARFSRCSAEQSDLSLIFRDLDLRPGRERGWDA